MFILTESNDVHRKVERTEDENERMKNHKAHRWMRCLAEWDEWLCEWHTVWQLSAYFKGYSSDSSMNQDKDLKVKQEEEKWTRETPLSKGILGWVFWFTSPFTRAWHRHRIVLVCTPYSWVLCLLNFRYLGYGDYTIKASPFIFIFPAVGVQASTTLCRCQARINGEASQKTQPNIALKRGFYLLLFSSSYFNFKIFILIHACLLHFKFI